MVRRLFWLTISLMTPLSVLLFAVGVPQSRAAETAVTAAPLDVIISEVAWGGTAASAADEWLELYNNTSQAIDLTGWTLIANDGFPNITLNGTIPAGGFFLLERTDDNTISDIPADQIFTGDLNNTTDGLTLRDNQNQVIDTANADGGPWPAGSGSPGYFSMERINPLASGIDANWVSNEGDIAANGLDANGNPVNGTPKAPNSLWSFSNQAEADLTVQKIGPTSIPLSGTLTYAITLQNSGSHTATDVILTDTLPLALNYVNDNSGYTAQEPIPNTLVWQIGTVPTGTLITFQLTATIQATTAGYITNTIHATTSYTETNLANNTANAVTYLDDGLRPIVLLYAVYYDGIEDTDDKDEAVALRNVGLATADLGNWQLGNGSTNANIATNTLLHPGETLWLTKDAAAFAFSFGFQADAVLSPWPRLANDGDEVILRDNNGIIQDVLIYEGGDVNQNGWSGPAVQPYTVPSVFGEKGQVIYRRLDQATGLPVPDTNTAVDWASWRDDVINGRKVRYPGWDLEQFFFTKQITETGIITIAIAPDNAYEAVVAALDSAQHTIQIQSHTFENLGIAAALERAAAVRGVSVTVLLEGGPPGGIPDQEKYICAQIETAGGACWFMISDDPADIADRYSYLHAKFILLDGQRAIISSENLSPNSLPYDDKSDGTWGRRGIVLLTDAPGVVQHLQAIFDADFAPAQHADIFRWNTGSATYGLPSVGFVPITVTGGITYPVRYPETAVFTGNFPFEIVQSPENSLRDRGGLLGLLNQAGAGDTILVQQLTERPYWGSSTSNPIADPNPRLEAYVNAARRGATVRILLDSFFDTPSAANSNAATCRYANDIAQNEDLNLRCAVNNPTGLGIHNKMVLVQVNGRGYAHVGSINGTELSSKGNRELAVQVQSDALYSFLATMFHQDWPWRLYLPLLYNKYIGPATYPLISEILYDPAGSDDAEFIELVNPTSQPIDLSGYSIGDAVHPTDFEDVRIFPAGTIILPGKTLVIATTATGFYRNFGFNPDFEILETDTAVPSLIDDPNWGDPATFLQLGNQGDEVILRNPAGVVIDVVTYGTGHYPGVVSCPLVPAPNYSLERYPYWRDTDDCSFDFRIWAFPNPGFLP